MTPLVLLCALNGAELLPAAIQDVWIRSTRLSAQGAHGAADTLSRSQPWSRRPEGLVLRATLSLGAFADLHAPERLARAEVLLDQALDSLEHDRTDRGAYLRMLALSQSSYLAALRGSEFRASLKGREAASIAQDLLARGVDDPDVLGVAGSYLFWKAQVLGPLRSAFGGDTRGAGLTYTVRAASSASALREIWRTSLVWIRFERKEYPLALQLARQALADIPDNRLYHQAEGDILFRMGRLDESLERYRSSWTEYAGIEEIPVNRISAAGNLARIHFAAGRRDSARAWLDTLDAPRYKACKSWLPPSLKRELEPVRGGLQ